MEGDPDPPVSMSESLRTTSADESGSKPSVFGVNRGFRIWILSASTPLQYVGCTVQAGELVNVMCDNVTFSVQATSKSRGPVPKPTPDDLFSAASYHGQPPPSTTLLSVAAPTMATFVRLEPHSTAVGPFAQYSVGQRGFCMTGMYGVYAENIVVFCAKASVRLEARAMDAVMRYVAGPLKTTTAPAGYAAVHMSMARCTAAVSSVWLSPTAPAARTSHTLLPAGCNTVEVWRLNEGRGMEWREPGGAELIAGTV